MLDDERNIPNELIEYDEHGRVKRRGNPERGDTVPVAWCSPHQCHPEVCFELHYPNAHRKDPDGQVSKLPGKGELGDLRAREKDAP